MPPVTGILLNFIKKLLDLFKQKLFVYVEVSFNFEPPYCLIIINRSGYTVKLERLIVTPDGFPSMDNGWLFSESTLFQNKILKPGQRIKAYLKTDQIGIEIKREFSVSYYTILKGSLIIKRKEESCVHTFEPLDSQVQVRSSFSSSYDIKPYQPD